MKVIEARPRPSTRRVEGARTAGVNAAAAVAGRKSRFPDLLFGGLVSSHPTALKLTPTSACLVPPLLVSHINQCLFEASQDGGV
jgi:hypothetical protein